MSADPEPSASRYDPPSTRITPAATNAVSAAAHHLPLRCTRCGDVIGIYEPLVILTAGDGKVHETSLAAQPDLSPHGEYYHRDCSGQR